MNKLKIFIPIKQHSSRVPNKNFRSFNGNSLWRRCLDKFNGFNINIDTDSVELYENVKKSYSANIYMRHESLIGDDVSVNKLIHYFIVNNCSPDDIVCQIHITSPFLTPNTIIDNYNIMKTTPSIDSIFSCTKHHKRFYNENITPINHNPKQLIPTQNLPPIYEDNSLFYMCRCSSFLKEGLRICGNYSIYETKYPEYMDIDNKEDWDLCTAIDLTMRGGNNENTSNYVSFW